MATLTTIIQIVAIFLFGMAAGISGASHLLIGREKPALCDVEGCGNKATQERTLRLTLGVGNAGIEGAAVACIVPLCEAHATAYDATSDRTKGWHMVAGISLIMA